MVLSITIDRVEINIGTGAGAFGRDLFGTVADVFESPALPAGLWQYDEDICGCASDGVWNT